MGLKRRPATRIPLDTRLMFAEYLFRNSSNGDFLRSKLEDMVISASQSNIPVFTPEDVLETRKSYRADIGFAESELNFLACEIADLLTDENQKYVHRIRSAGFSPSRNRRQEIELILREEELEKMRNKKAQFIPSYHPVSLHDSNELLEIINDIFYVLPFPNKDKTRLFANESEVYQISYRMKKFGIKSTVKIMGLEKQYPREVPENILGRIMDGWGVRVFIHDGFGKTESQNKCYDARLKVAQLFQGVLRENRFGREMHHLCAGEYGKIVDHRDYFRIRTSTGFKALYLTVISRTGQACEIQFLTKSMYNRNEDSRDSTKREYKADKYEQFFHAMNEREKEIFYHVMKWNFIMFDERTRKSATEIFYNFENEVKLIRRILEERKVKNVPKIFLPNERIIY